MTNPTLPKGQLFINGQWRDAADGATSPTFNPANELEIMRVAQATLDDVDDAVDSAYDAFENGEWRKMGPHHRARVLNKIGDLIEENLIKYDDKKNPFKNKGSMVNSMERLYGVPVGNHDNNILEINKTYKKEK